MIRKTLLLILFLPLALFSEIVETFYGPLEVTEPVILELIESDPFQRLKDVHQYGISYYTTHQEEYNRYDHSLGVFAILRKKGASLQEQIAGLLHDVSHTVFSHVGDYVFGKVPTEETYQDDIHGWFLEKYGLGKILAKHGFSIKDVDPKSGKFAALEQELPNLCADRIDYNLQGAFHQGFLSHEEVRQILDDLNFVDGKWVSSKPGPLRKLVRFSIHMSQHCWGSPVNYLLSSWLAEAISEAVKLGHLTKEDITYGRDHHVWNKLTTINDPTVQNLFLKIYNPHKHFTLGNPEEADLHPTMKFRGINPWIKHHNALIRLTDYDEELAKEYLKGKTLMEKGWPIKLTKQGQ